jgi:hypothetical protein
VKALLRFSMFGWLNLSDILYYFTTILLWLF